MEEKISLLTANEAFSMLANSNRFADARAQDNTLRAYIGLWKRGELSGAKKRAMLAKYGFKDVYLPTFIAPPILGK